MMENMYNSKQIRKVSELFIQTGILLASLHYEYKNTERAMGYLNFIKYEAEKSNKFTHKIHIYLKLSEVASLMGKYRLGLIYAQRSLE